MRRRGEFIGFAMFINKSVPFLVMGLYFNSVGLKGYSFYNEAANERK